MGSSVELLWISDLESMQALRALLKLTFNRGVCVCVFYMSTVSFGGQKGALDPLDLEFQVVFQPANMGTVFANCASL